MAVRDSHCTYKLSASNTTRDGERKPYTRRSAVFREQVYISTEGVPVMYINHRYSSNKSIDYKKYGKEILKCLSQTLRISGIGMIYLCFDDI